MCTRELTAYENPEGGRPIFGWTGRKLGLPELKLPCGKCPECQKDYYTQWAARGSRELLRWPTSLFITLTYNEKNLPHDHSLNKKEIQDFIKRLKKTMGSSKENPIRQIYCGEYGTKTHRPHYHVILFNCDFTDRKPFRISERGDQIYTSERLTSLWGKGNVEFGIATPGGVAYLFKYILKKKTRKEKLEPYVLPNGLCVEHEFIEASRNPGIGAHLRDSDSIKKGYLFIDGVRTKLPKYYKEHLKVTNPRTHEKLADLRFDYAKTKKPETELRKKQKEAAQKRLTDTKKRL